MNEINPRIRIACMSDNHGVQNNFSLITIFIETSIVKVVKMTPHKNNADLYRAMVEFDRMFVVTGF